MTDTVFLGVGSNVAPTRNIAVALEELDAAVTLRRISTVYRSAAIGFDGADFLNLVVEARSALAPGALHRKLREIEYRHGREPSAGRFAPRHVDIDILLMGERRGTIDGVELPRAEITENAFVLAPLAEIAPALIMPGQTHNLEQLWHRYSKQQTITPIDFEWRGTLLPCPSIPVAGTRA